MFSFISKQLKTFWRRFATSSKKPVTLRVDGKQITVTSQTRLIDAIQKANSAFPAFCYHSDVPESGGICRVCLCEDKTNPNQPIISCQTNAKDGMDISTVGSDITRWRQTNASLLFHDHPIQCLSCGGNQRCETQNFAAQVGLATSVTKSLVGQSGKNYLANDFSTFIERRPSLCVNCDRCVYTCRNLQGYGVFGTFNYGNTRTISPFAQLQLLESECIQCGQCIDRCPTYALSEKNEVPDVMKAIHDKSKRVVFQMAPAIRAGIAEEFGYEPGQLILKEELVTAAKRLGENVYFFDTDFTADLTIIEEGSELLERLTRVLAKKKMLGGDHMKTALPLLTSCCPAWVQYIEKHYPEFLDNVSSCKSPQQMMGALVKGYWTKNVLKKDPKDTVVVSIMPCTAKKYEKSREELEVDGNRDVDYVLTTREFAKLLRENNINPCGLPKTPFDSPLGSSTGAAVLFGATGGVMEAALRTAYELVTGETVPFKNLNIAPVRGMEFVREATIPITKTVPKYSFLKGAELRVAVAHSIGALKAVMEKMRECKEAGKPYPWDFVEFMACPGGCIGGGGQPKPTNTDARMARVRLIYQDDHGMVYRKSHENPDVVRLYQEFLKAPLGENSHKYLHTHYISNPLDWGKWVDMSKGMEIEKHLDSKFPEKRRDLLIEMLHSEVDRSGWLSDAAIVTLANKLKMHPVEIDSLASSYHVFHREPVGEYCVYVCNCHNCQMKGSNNIMNRLVESMGLEDSPISTDGKWSLKSVNWLGWCVNEGPGIMIKKRGTDHITTISGATPDITLEELETATSKTPQDNIYRLSMTRFGENNPSFFKKLPIESIAKKSIEMGSDAIINELIEAGLQGRGGAGFSTGLKWKFARAEKGKEKYVVCNADEGLPSTFKDYALLTSEESRKQMLLGMAICAKTIGADKNKSVEKFKADNPDYKSLSFEVRLGAGPYIAGEETTLFDSIEGKGARPRIDRSKFPTQSGLFGKPTVINNVETFTAVPHVLNSGGKAWASLGKNGQKGIKLISISGDVSGPMLVEYPLGTTIKEVIDEIGVKNVHAVEVGGATEPLLMKSSLDKPLGFGPNYVNAVGSFVVFNKSRDLFDIYTKKMEFMNNESCKQCVPCRDGSKLFVGAMKEWCEGLRAPGDAALLAAADTAKTTSICGHGKALGALFHSIDAYATKYFQDRLGHNR